MSKKDKNQNIQVYVRCRPINTNEQKQKSPSIVEVNSATKEIIIKEKVGEKDLQKTFMFDRVFGPDATQLDVYKTVVGNLIEEVLTGYNCTVFAYGQTGTGKTHTMQGCRSEVNMSWEKDPQSGIIPRTLHHLFEKLATQDSEYNVRVSFLELYNEELFDLLAPLNDMSKLRIFEDSTKKGSVVIQGLAETMVHNKDEVYAILERGTDKRRTASTLMNDTSSRSHTVFSVTVHIKENSLEGEDLLKIGKLNLVDLAGSECIGRSGAIDRRAREAGSINQSLLTLGRVITALVEKAPHVPYRESKLTRLLQDSLGGRTKTSIIATISPAYCNLEETLSTLDYAHRAKNITNKPEVNQKLTKKALIKEYTEEIERLRKDLIATREKNGIFVDEDNFRMMESRISEQGAWIKEKIADIDALKEELEKVTELFDFTKKELKTKEEALVVTKNVLCKTERKLSNTTNALKTLSKTCAEQQYLVRHQAKVEKTLASQANQLLEVAEKATVDVSGVWNKLDRKIRVESSNETKSSNFGKTFDSTVSCIEDTINNMFQDNSKYMASFMQDFEFIKAKSQEASCRQKGFMRQMEVCFEEQTNQLNLSLDASLKAITNKIADLDVRPRQLIENMMSANNEFYSRTFNSVMGKMLGLVGAQNLFFQEMHYSFQSQIKQIDEDVKQHKNKINANLEKLSKQMEVAFKEQQSYLDVIDEQKTSIEDERTSFLQNWQEQEEKVSAAMASMKTFIKNHSSLLDDKLPKVWDMTEMITTNKEAFSVEAKTLTSEMGSSVSDMETSLTGKLQELNSELECHHKAGQSHISKVQEAGAEVKQQVEENVCSTAEFLDQFKHCLGGNEMELRSFILRNEAVNRDIVESNHRLNMDKLKKIQSEKDNYDLAVEEGNSHLNSHSSEVAKMAACWQPLLAKGLEDQLRLVDDYLNVDLQKDIATGQTPERREYNYPRYLAATSPHERILERLRKNLDIDQAARTFLPVDLGEADSESGNLLGIRSSAKDLNTSAESVDSTKSQTSNCSERAEDRCCKNGTEIEAKENTKSLLKRPAKRFGKTPTSSRNKGVLIDSNATPLK